LKGQYVALASLINPLPLPSITMDSTIQLYLMSTLPQDTQSFTPVLNGSGPAWRADFISYIPPVLAVSNQGAPIGLIAGTVVGSILGLGLLIAIGAFAFWRYRREPEDLMPDQINVNMPSFSVSTPMRPNNSTIQKTTSNSSLISQPTSSSLVIPLTSNGRPSTAVLPRGDSESLYNTNISNPSYRNRGLTLKTSGFVMCSRCTDDKDKAASIACVECKNYFCHQCSIELHFGTGSGNWSSHTIRPLKLVQSESTSSTNPILYCPECGTARLDSPICTHCKFNFDLIPKQTEEVRIYT